MLGDDLVDIVTSAFEADGGVDALDDPDELLEPDIKFDPNAVKTELIIFDENDEEVTDAYLRGSDFENISEGPQTDPIAGEDGDNAEDDDECPIGRRRSKRNRKPTIKDPLAIDPCDDANDEDWHTWKPPKKKRVVTARTIRKNLKAKKERYKSSRKAKRENMTPEEREKQREAWRNEMRIRRERERKRKELEELVTTEGSASVEGQPRTKRKAAQKKEPVDESETDEPVKRGRGRKKTGGRSSQRRSSGAGGRRKKVSEMTEEEREMWKAKWREEARLKRERQRQKMTQEEREEYLRIQRERRREQRALQRVTMTEEEREEMNKKARERKKEKRRSLTAEEKRERAQRVTMRRIERLAQMTEEEKAQYRMNNYMSYMARLARMAPEEIEARRQKRREYARKRLQTLTEEERERRRQKIRQYRWNMDPERKARFLERLREGYKRRVERLKAEGKWDEVKERWRKENKERKQNSNEPTEEKKKRRRKTGISYKSKLLPNETEEERRQRLREAKRRTNQRAKIKKRLAVQQLLEAGLTMEEINRQMETPEQRERRLMKCRINKAKLDLRKRLVVSGAPPEEIEVRLKEVEETYQPSRNFRPYKPRQDTLKPIHPEELKILEEPTPPKPKLKPKMTVSSGSAPAFSVPEASTSVKSSLHEHPDVKPKEQSDASQYFNADFVASPASNCSYVSAATTPEPLALIHPQISANQSQYQTQPQPCMYQNFHQSSYSHHIPPQTHSFSLFSDGFNPFVTPVANTSQSQHQMTGNMQYQSRAHHEYPPSYAPSSPAPSSPPASPDLFAKHEDSQSHFSTSSSNNFAPSTADHSLTLPDGFQRKRGRPRKGDPPVIKPPKKFPSGKRKIGVPIGSSHKDVICDECGNFYSFNYILTHKRTFHNPLLKNGQCTLCGETFTTSRFFHKHIRAVHPEKAPKGRLTKDTHDFQCEDCGRGFTQFNNMQTHWYYAHGDGSKEENFHECPVCKKRIKHKLTYRNHLTLVHPDFEESQKYKCARCTSGFTKEHLLKEHVKEAHPEAYFPCKYCSSFKYTDLGLKYHFSYGCLKVPKEEHERIRKELGDNSIERFSIQCEFCERSMCIMSLHRHYWEMHNVREEPFSCDKCDHKKFRRREYWVAHVMDHHNIHPDEWKDGIRKLNVKDREGLEIKNKDGKTGGGQPVNFQRIHKVRTLNELAEKKDGEVDGNDSGCDSKKATKKGKKRKSGKGRATRRKKIKSDNEGETEEEVEGNELSAPKARKKRLPSKSGESDDDDDYAPPSSRRRSSSRICGRSRSRSRGGETDSEGEDDDDDMRKEVEDQSDVENEDEEKSVGDKEDSDEDFSESPTPGTSKSNILVPLSDLDLENVVKTEVLSDEEDVQIAWIYKDD